MTPCQIPPGFALYYITLPVKYLIKHMYVNLGTKEGLTLHHVLITEISMSTCTHVLAKGQSRLAVLSDSCLPYSSDRVFYWFKTFSSLYLFVTSDQAVSIPISLIVKGGEIFYATWSLDFFRSFYT